MSTDIVISIASVCIALCALLFTFWQTKVGRDHNKISVKPHLTTSNFTDIDNRVISMNVLNNGLGPAIIKKFEIRVDGKILDGNEPIETAIKIIFPNIDYQLRSGSMAIDYALGEKENLLFLALKFKEGFDMNKEEVLKAIDRGDLIIEYESFYGEKFCLDTRDETA